MSATLARFRTIARLLSQSENATAEKREEMDQHHDPSIPISGGNVPRRPLFETQGWAGRGDLFLSGEDMLLFGKDVFLFGKDVLLFGNDMFLF